MAQERGRTLPASRRRWPALGVLCAVAAAIHLLALGGLRWAWPQTDVALPAARVMAVRQLPGAETAAPPRPVEPPVATASIAAAPAVPPAPAPSPAPARRSRSGRGAPAASASPAVAVTEPVRAADATARSALLSTVAGEATEDTLPHYRTQIPTAATLHYQVRHGPLSGSGELRWRPDADHYELTLDIDVGGSPALTQLSQGGFDDAGLAPLRFTDKRLRRPASAANFQRDAGTITFSGPSTRFPLRPGSQDRLSWLLQLPAIVAAEPSLRDAGSRVAMNVATANGDVAVWVFRCQGVEPVDGAEDVLVYRRESHGPYDTSVTVSLDPRRGFLPLQASWQSGASDAGFELRLQDMTLSP